MSDFETAHATLTCILLLAVLVQWRSIGILQDGALGILDVVKDMLAREAKRAKEEQKNG